MAVTPGILDSERKEKLIFECARSKSFTISHVKTLVKALYFSRGKDNPIGLAYKELKSVGLPSPIKSTGGVGKALPPNFGTRRSDIEFSLYSLILFISSSSLPKAVQSIAIWKTTPIP